MRQLKYIFLSFFCVFFLFFINSCGSGNGEGDNAEDIIQDTTSDTSADTSADTPTDTLPDNIQFVPYKDSVNNIYLLYPDGWSVMGNSEIPVGFKSPQNNPDDIFAENLIIDYYDPEDTSEEEEGDLSEINILDITETLLSGLPAIKIVFEAVLTDYDIELRGFQIIALVNDKFCIISYVAQKLNYEIYLAIINEMIGSLHIGVTVADCLHDAGSDTESPGAPAIAFDGERYIVLTYKYPATGIYDTPVELIGVFVDNDLTVSSPFTIHQFTLPWYSSLDTPSVQFDGDNYMVVFRDTSETYSGATYHIYGARITPDGDVLDADQPVMISDEDQSGYLPTISFNGDNFLVAWVGPGLTGEPSYINYRAIYAALISKDGTVIDRFKIFSEYGLHANRPLLASNGDGFIAVWENYESDLAELTEIDLTGSRISNDGIVINPEGVPIANGPGKQTAASISFDGENYLISWLDIQSEIPFYPQPSSIHSRRLSSEGPLVVDEPGIPEIVIDESDDPKEHLYQAFDGANHFLVWKTGSFNNNNPSGLFSSWISPSGDILDISDDVFGANFTGPPPDSSRLVYPKVCFGYTEGLVIWINNIELSGETKSLHGIFMESSY